MITHASAIESIMASFPVTRLIRSLITYCGPSRGFSPSKSLTVVGVLTTIALVRLSDTLATDLFLEAVKPRFNSCRLSNYISSKRYVTRRTKIKACPASEESVYILFYIQNVRLIYFNNNLFGGFCNNI